MTSRSIAPQPRFARRRLSTNLRVHYAEQGAPGGETVVFVHGWPDSWFSFSRVLRRLTPSLHALAPDLRGFGDSERLTAGYSIDQLATDLAAFLEVEGVNHVTLVGHSMGSFIARRVAGTHPELVRRLVLIGSAVTPVNSVTREVQEVVRKLVDPITPEFVREFQSSTVDVPVPERFFEGLVAESLKAPAYVWRGALDGLLGFDDEPELGRIVAPTLILWGENDGLFRSLAEQERLAAAIPGARLVVYTQTGHSPNWERPERVAEEIERFMSESQPIGAALSAASS